MTKDNNEERHAGSPNFNFVIGILGVISVLGFAALIAMAWVGKDAPESITIPLGTAIGALGGLLASARK